MSNETTIDPYALAAEALEQIIVTEFTAEQFVPIHDNVHESLGLDRVTIGIAPQREALLNTNSLASDLRIEIRFYDLWDKEVNPEQLVNPRKITMYANRLKRALQQSRFTYEGDNATPEMWYFDWVDTEYINDPTGNKTRFHMHVRAYGDNTALIETR